MWRGREGWGRKGERKGGREWKEEGKEWGGERGERVGTRRKIENPLAPGSPTTK